MKHFGDWLRAWWPILLGFVAIWWQLHDDLNELKASQGIIIERINSLKGEIDTLKADLDSIGVRIGDVERHAFTHRHGD